MKRQNSFDVSNPAGSNRIEIGAGLQSLVSNLKACHSLSLHSKQMAWCGPPSPNFSSYTGIYTGHITHLSPGSQNRALRYRDKLNFQTSEHIPQILVAFPHYRTYLSRSDNTCME
ncbi:hypothetical protein AVEN_90028-1 [Araneus ventricosus]|uniref:Uncharacterized protein n=1 Tax=Araneus ventricosus TaxID=182803 RepID=A0A4Y2UPH6_ARAVE|nr:hypothetical protein AVEN_90028-1 [Araneus ventricosus]